MQQRHYSPIDKFIIDFDAGLAAIFTGKAAPQRASPARDQDESALDTVAKRRSQGYMRVNHAGEIAAQALYQGQAWTARSRSIQDSLRQSAAEEADHLDWCRQRLQQLGTHPSYLNPLWYLGAFSMGALAGVAGDKWSLGFLAETEHQVVVHLETHLQKLPLQDSRSRLILEQMKRDEAHHATVAIESGAADLPAKIKKLMRLCSRVMTTTAYWI